MPGSSGLTTICSAEKMRLTSMAHASAASGASLLGSGGARFIPTRAAAVLVEAAG